jgi:hypothetical protein
MIVGDNRGGSDLMNFIRYIPGVPDTQKGAEIIPFLTEIHNVTLTADTEDPGFWNYGI